MNKKIQTLTSIKTIFEHCNLLQPGKCHLDMETSLICDIIDDNDSVGSSVVAGSNCSESFLSSRVPLKIDTVQYKEIKHMIRNTPIQIHDPLRLSNKDVCRKRVRQGKGGNKNNKFIPGKFLC